MGRGIAQVAAATGYRVLLADASLELAEKGKATQAIRELLADSLGIAPCRVTLIQGETQPKKLFLLEGISQEQARTWLETILS